MPIPNSTAARSLFHRASGGKRKNMLDLLDPQAYVLCSFYTVQAKCRGSRMVPLYACRIEDLGPGDFVKVDCTMCDHTALLAPVFLFRLGLEPRDKVLDLRPRVRCRGCGVRG